MAHRNLKVLDAAKHAAKQLNELIDRSRGQRLLHVRQMRDSAQSVAGNISEAFGRASSKGRDRDRSLEIARGESEETISHLAANFEANRIDKADYYRLRNLYIVIVKMLNAIING
jgi:four helix bundle protein